MDKGNKVGTTVKKGGDPAIPPRADAARRLREPPVRIPGIPGRRAGRRFGVGNVRGGGAAWPDARLPGPRRVPLPTGCTRALRARLRPSVRRGGRIRGSRRVHGRPPRGSPSAGDPSRQPVLPSVPLPNAAQVPFPVAAGPRRGRKRAYLGDSRATQAGVGGAGAAASSLATTRIAARPEA